MKEPINNGAGIDANKLFGIANEAFGGTQAAGVYCINEAYDALELGGSQPVSEDLRLE